MKVVITYHIVNLVRMFPKPFSILTTLKYPGIKKPWQNSYLSAIQSWFFQKSVMLCLNPVRGVKVCRAEFKKGGFEKK